jgi:hypothetical protein
MMSNKKIYAFNMPMDSITHYQSKAFETFKDSSGEMGSFMTKRLHEDMSLGHKLASCKHPVDILETWADFYKTAFNDYSAQATKMFGLMERVTDESQAVAKDVAEAGEAILEQMEGKAA